MAWAPGAAAQHGDPTTTVRLGSDDADATAIATSRARFADGEAASAVLSRNDVFADALAGAPLTDEGPLLFTPSHGLSDVVGDELERVLPTGSTVFLLGGDAALSPAVESGVEERGFSVRRLSGPSRIETAIAIADEVRRRHPDNQEVAVARAYGTADNPTAAWADAVTGGAWAAATGTPILITPTEGVVEEVAEWIAADRPTRTVVLGGAGAVSLAAFEALPLPQRVSGVDRAATAAAVATQLWGERPGVRSVLVVNGWVDAGWRFGLAAAGLGSDLDAPVLLTAADHVPAVTLELLRGACGEDQVDLAVVGGTTPIPAPRVEDMDAVDGVPCPALDLEDDAGTYVGRPDVDGLIAMPRPAMFAKFDDRGSEVEVTVADDGTVDVRVRISLQAPWCGDGETERPAEEIRQTFHDLGLGEQVDSYGECFRPRMLEVWTGTGQWTGPGETLLVDLDGVRTLEFPDGEDGEMEQEPVITSPPSLRLSFDGSGFVTATGQLAGQPIELVAHAGGPPVLQQCKEGTGRATRYLAHGFGSVWATAAGNGVWRFDEDTMQELQIPLGGDNISDIVAGPDAIWVATYSGNLYRIDPETNGVTEVDVGGFPEGLQVIDGGLWLAGAVSGHATRVDLQTLQVEHVPIEGEVGLEFSTAVVDGWYWVATDQGVARVDTRERKATLTPVDTGAWSLHPHADGVAVTHRGVGHVTGLDRAGNLRWTQRIHEGAVEGAHGAREPVHARLVADELHVFDASNEPTYPPTALSPSSGTPLRRLTDDENDTYTLVAGQWRLTLDTAQDRILTHRAGSLVPLGTFAYDRPWFWEGLEAAGALWWTDQQTDGAVCRAAPA